MAVAVLSLFPSKRMPINVRTAYRRDNPSSVVACTVARLCTTDATFCIIYDAYYVDISNSIVYSTYMLFEIGENIRLTRKSRKITQAEMAKALGMSRTTIGQIENGTVQEIGVRKLIRVLEFLGLELKVRPAGRPPTLEELREEESR